MSDRVADRLSTIASFLVDLKRNAVAEWHAEHSVASRLDQSPSTRNSYIYDRTYGFAVTAVNPPLPISVEGQGRQRFIVVRDGLGPPIAVWMKALRRLTLHTSNYWTKRTRMQRTVGSLYDMDGNPELVICGHTMLVDRITGTVEIEDVWLTREVPNGSDSRRRIVSKLRRLFNYRLGLIGQPMEVQGALFTPEIADVPPAPIVRPRQPVRPVAPATDVPAMPKVDPQPAAQQTPAAEAEQKKAEGA